MRRSTAARLVPAPARSPRRFTRGGGRCAGAGRPGRRRAGTQRRIGGDRPCRPGSRGRASSAAWRAGSTGSSASASCLAILSTVALDRSGCGRQRRRLLRRLRVGRARVDQGRSISAASCLPLATIGDPVGPRRRGGDLVPTRSWRRTRRAERGGRGSAPRGGVLPPPANANCICRWAASASVRRRRTTCRTSAAQAFERRPCSHSGAGRRRDTGHERDHGGHRECAQRAR